MRTPEIREAPVPVRGWHAEGYSFSDWMSAVEQRGWSTNIKGAAAEVIWHRDNGNGQGVAFLMSDGSKIIVRAKP